MRQLWFCMISVAFLEKSGFGKWVGILFQVF